MRVLCIYDPTNLDSLLSAAIVKQWYVKTHQDPIFKGEHIWIKDMDNNPEANDPSECLYLRKFTKENMQRTAFQNYGVVIMVGVLPDDRLIQKIFDAFVHFVWITNQVDKEKDGKPHGWMFPGNRDTKSSTFELTWSYYMKEEEMPSIHYSTTILDVVDNYLAVKRSVAEQK